VLEGAGAGIGYPSVLWGNTEMITWLRRDGRLWSGEMNDAGWYNAAYRNISSPLTQISSGSKEFMMFSSHFNKPCPGVAVRDQFILDQ
jgi:hypothetical protein